MPIREFNENNEKIEYFWEIKSNSSSISSRCRIPKETKKNIFKVETVGNN